MPAGEGWAVAVMNRRGFVMVCQAAYTEQDGADGRHKSIALMASTPGGIACLRLAIAPAKSITTAPRAPQATL